MVTKVDLTLKQDHENHHTYSVTESTLIDAMRTIFTQDDYLPNFEDDCAYKQSTHLQLMSTDAVCEGVHFDRQWDSLWNIGAQAAIVNLSDVAASGGQAHSFLWSLSMPPTLSKNEVLELAQGFAHVAKTYAVHVKGGNICVRPGPLEIHVTVLGECQKKPISRLGLESNDVLYVTGVLGERALGYLFPSIQTREVRHQWRPHLEESQILQEWGRVHVMMDVSDGLFQECERLAHLNRKHIDLESTKIPLSKLYQTLCGHNLEAALNGGEDYVLLFSSSFHDTPPSLLTAYPIGRVRALSDPNETAHVYLDQEKVESEGFLHRLESSIRSSSVELPYEV